MLKQNKLKAALKQGKIVYGSWLNLSSPSVAEIMAQAGHDFLMIDGEHTAVSNETAQAMMQAMAGTDCTPVMRVAWNDPVRIKQALDIGAQGLVIPVVNTRAEAIAAVQACRYPPAGIRGLAGSRPSNWGAEMADYVKVANDEICVILQIEHPDAVANVEEIVSVEGIDVAYIGVADLASFMGFGGQMSNLDPSVDEAIAKVVAAAKRANVPLGIHCLTAEDAAQRALQGFTYVAVGGDGRYVAHTARETLRELKTLVEQGRRR